MKKCFYKFLFTGLTLVFYLQANAQVDARMLRYPDVSETQIVFTYAGDLWIAPKTGGTAHQLSSPKGEEYMSRFSPDGKSIAFSANYTGSLNIYVIPSVGGTPTAITHHGMTDRILDWYPDGKSLLFASSRESEKQRFMQLYKVSKEGGLPEKLPLPYGEFASLSPDGKQLAFTPKTRAFRTWKRYRGGMATDVFTFDLGSYASKNISNHIANDEFPMWHNKTIYFLSDRGEEKRYNIWAYETESQQIRQVTNFKNEDVHFPAIGPSDIIFEAGGRLYLLNLGNEKYNSIEINLVTDKATLLPKSVNAADYIQSIDISPDGKRVLFEARGDIFSVPAEHGFVKDLTRTSGVAERFPAWSPDGKYLAYWSDRNGEYELAIMDLVNGEKESILTQYGPGFRYNIFWSPDSKKLAFMDNAMKIFVYNRDTKATRQVDKGSYFFEGALRSFRVSWSPDSRWMAYYKDMPNTNYSIFIYDEKNSKSHQVTSGFYSDFFPLFDPEGNYLYLVTNRNFSPVYSDFDNTFIYPNATHLAAIALRADVPSPLAPRNDVVDMKKDEDKEKKDDKEKNGKDNGEDKDKKDENETEAVEIDFEDIESRMVVLPPKPGNFGSIAAAKGKLLFHKGPNSGSASEERPLMFYDLKEREEKTIIDDVDFFILSANCEKLLISKDRAYSVVNVEPGQKMDKKVPADNLEMMVDPQAEWKQIFTDAWRFERDFFYDPNMHGLDWNAIRKQYEALLSDAVTRWDVNYIIGEMIGEMNASHTYRGGGDTEEAKDRHVGYLGINWAVKNGKYQVKKIIRPAPWETEVRSPLDKPGVDVKEGDYILAVNGVALDPSKDPWAAFEGLANKTVELKVNRYEIADSAKTLVVTLLDDETRLRNLAWIESNRQYVDKATNGRVGYVYVPSTGRDGQFELVRQFYAQWNKDGLIIDERWNNGGQIPDRFVELLNRPLLGYFAVRDGIDWQWPPTAHFGPKVMLINGWSGSGGDAFPDYFRKHNVGPLIGTRTWGGLIGLSGSPQLIDNGVVTIPTFRMYDPDGTWFREGHGVDPDIEVPEDPTALAKGTDTQLERAIKEVKDRLTTYKGKAPRPAYEDRN